MIFFIYAAEGDPVQVCVRLKRPEGESGHEWLVRYDVVLKNVRGGHILCATSGGNGSPDCKFRDGNWDHILYTKKGSIDLSGKTLESYTVKPGDIDAWYWHEKIPAGADEGPGPDEGNWPGNYTNWSFDWPQCGIPNVSA